MNCILYLRRSKRNNAAPTKTNAPAMPTQPTTANIPTLFKSAGGALGCALDAAGAERTRVGRTVGSSCATLRVGRTVGASVGATVGSAVGSSVGAAVGSSVGAGASVGGTRVGFTTGASVGGGGGGVTVGCIT